MPEVSTQYFLGETEIINSFVGDVPVLINPFEENPFFDGLVFYVDAGIDASYPTGSAPITGSEWYNLVYNQTGSLFGRVNVSGIPTWNAISGGYFSVFENGVSWSLSPNVNERPPISTGSNDSFTLSAWAKVEDVVPNAQQLIGYSTFDFSPSFKFTGVNLVASIESDPKIQLYCTNTSTSSIIVQRIVGGLENNWVHYAATKEKSTNLVKLYVNGNLIHSQSANTEFYPDFDAAQISVGFKSDDFTPQTGSIQLPLTGDISNAQIYNRALNDIEIKNIYDRFKDRFGL
jgi:hypothetical protein